MPLTSRVTAIPHALGMARRRRIARTRTIWEVTALDGTVAARCSTWAEAFAERQRLNRELRREEYSVEARTARLFLVR